MTDRFYFIIKLLLKFIISCFDRLVKCITQFEHEIKCYPAVFWPPCYWNSLKSFVFFTESYNGTKSNPSLRKRLKALRSWNTCEHHTILFLYIIILVSQKCLLLLLKDKSCCYLEMEKWDAVLSKSYHGCVWSIFLLPCAGTLATMASCRYILRHCPIQSSKCCE